MSKKKKIVIGTSVAVLVAIIGIYKFRSQDAGMQMPPVWVEAVRVKESALPLEASAIGTLSAKSVNITSETPGQVQSVLFTDGASIKRGQPLIQLDDAIYKAKYASAQAQLVYSENNYKRMRLLGKQGAIAQQAIDQADADFKQRKAAAEESRVILSKMQLTAPFDGMVGKSLVNPGDYVTVGQNLVTITDIKHLHVEYTIPESYIGALKQGQEVKVTTTAYPDRVFTGKVAFISPTVNAENRSLSVYAEIANDKNELAAGMFVNVSQTLGSEKNALTIPARSLVPSLEGEQVYKVVQGNAVAVPVIIGKRTQNEVQIIKGLTPSDIIVTDGQLKLKNGVPVKIKT